jgi:hypothetical protein
MRLLHPARAERAAGMVLGHPSRRSQMRVLVTTSTGVSGAEMGKL